MIPLHSETLPTPTRTSRISRLFYSISRHTTPILSTHDPPIPRIRPSAVLISPIRKARARRPGREAILFVGFLRPQRRNTHNFLFRKARRPPRPSLMNKLPPSGDQGSFPLTLRGIKASSPPPISSSFIFPILPIFPWSWPALHSGSAHLAATQLYLDLHPDMACLYPSSLHVCMSHPSTYLSVSWLTISIFILLSQIHSMSSQHVTSTHI